MTGNGFLPSRDVLMAAILMALMLTGAAAAPFVATGEKPFYWPGLAIMPGTYGLIWASYGITLVVLRRLEIGKHAKGMQRAADFMGLTLVVAGILLTVTHGGLLAYLTGRIDNLEFAFVFRVFAVGFGFVLMVVGNVAPKIMNPSRVTVVGNPRLMGWVSMLSGLACIVVAVTLPFDALTPVLVTIGLIPGAFNIVTSLTARRKTKSG